MPPEPATLCVTWQPCPPLVPPLLEPRAHQIEAHARRSKDLYGMVGIVEENCKRAIDQSNPSEVEIDIDSLDLQTFIKLNKYVDDCIKVRARAPASPRHGPPPGRGALVVRDTASAGAAAAKRVGAAPSCARRVCRHAALDQEAEDTIGVARELARAHRLHVPVGFAARRLASDGAARWRTSGIAKPLGRRGLWATVLRAPVSLEAGRSDFGPVSTRRSSGRGDYCELGLHAAPRHGWGRCTAELQLGCVADREWAVAP